MTSTESSGSVTFGQYHLIDLLGTGGMGTVYRADQPGLRRKVAIKVLNSAVIGQEDYAERFDREAQMAASLEHPHIVPVYDHGTTPDGINYVVMRLLTGGSLGQRLEQHREHETPLPTLAETGALLRQMASALDYAHRRGVIHRDIKPNNIMFDDQGNAYLVDFGIARLIQDGQKSGRTLTQTGMVVGTPAYIPPELWRGEEWTASADQYALGIVIYEMLSGRPPFEAPTLYQLIDSHLNATPPPLSVARPELPEALTPVLGRALSKSPEQRYETVGEFSRAFDIAVEDAVATASNMPSGFFSLPLPNERTRVLPQTPQRNLLLNTLTTSAELPAQSVDTPAVPSPIQDNSGSKTRLRRFLPALLGLIALLVVSGAVLLTIESNSRGATLQATLDSFQTAQAANPRLISAEMLGATTEACVANLAPVPSNVGQIAFQSDRSGSTNIYLMDADGTDVRRLTDSTANDQYPIWSPDGSSLVFISGRDGNSELYVLVSGEDRDTFEEVRITHNTVDDANPAWSPDGTRIAFASRLEGSWDIYVVDADGANLTRLTDHIATDYAPVWSPDGTQIAFVSERDGNGEIYVMNADGSNPRRITNSDANDSESIVWSPDGSRLAFVSIQTDGDWEIYTATLGDEPLVTPFSSLIGDEWLPQWSPDSRSLAYLWQTDNVDIIVEDADGTNRRTVTPSTSDDYTYTWSPDGTQITFETDRDGNWEIYSVDVCGGNEHRLTHNSADDLFPSWRPLGN
jgi:Tol biopolymer transport system component